MTAVATDTSCPLCVDMDGTLVATDLVWESMLLLIRTKPHRAAMMPVWRMRGLGHFKRRMAEHVMPDAARLPYRADVIEFLKNEKAAGRRIVLVTGSDEQVARAVAAHVGLFDEVIGSCDGVNCRGEEKLRTIRSRVGEAFDYIGDSH